MKWEFTKIIGERKRLVQEMNAAGSTIVPMGYLAYRYWQASTAHTTPARSAVRAAAMA